MTAHDANGGAGPHSEPRRKLVSPDRLLRLLNQRLEGYGHCHGCSLAGPIKRLSEPAEDGRNWSRFIPLVCGNASAGGCIRLAERIIDDATREYNLWEVEGNARGSRGPAPLKYARPSADMNRSEPRRAFSRPGHHSSAVRDHKEHHVTSRDSPNPHRPSFTRRPDLPADVRPRDGRSVDRRMVRA